MNKRGYVGLMEVLFSVFVITIAFVVFSFIYSFKSAQTDAILYNKKFNTNYTTSQFYWSGGTIKEFLNQGKQQTQNINIQGSVPVRIES